MPALRTTDHFGTITWLGIVPDRAASLRAVPAEAMGLGFAGPEGEAHGGLTRASCSRVRDLYPVGTEIRNVRQLSLLSVEDLAAIAAGMGLDDFDTAWAGATMVIGGLPDFTHLPPSSRLQAPSGATLVVDMQNGPCHLPAKVIDADAPGFGGRFKAAAAGRRGVTARVEREGRVALGERLRLFVPDQRAWAPST